MNNETDLDWLARNVHEWREGKREVLACCPRNVATLIWSSVSSDAGWITRGQWIARRAELQNKPTEWPKRANWLAQHDDGEWTFYADDVGCPPQRSDDGCWHSDRAALRSHHIGEVLGDWRDTLELRPQVEADITDPFDPEFRPVSVSNETVQLERPIAVAGTGNVSTAESSFLVGRVIDLLRTSVDHFSADELADMNELTGAELTKRDELVCGGQKYLDAHWFERGELPPVGVVCEAYIDYPPQWVEAEIVAHKDGFAIGWCKSVMKGCHGDKAGEFRPIPTDRDVLLSIIVEEMNRYDTDGKLADAILAAGFKRGVA